MSNEARKVPTRPGWWWREGNHGPYVVEVDDSDGVLFVVADEVRDDGSWLASIPSPAVCAALAEYARAGAAFDDAKADQGEAWTGDWYNALAESLTALREAIRAERAAQGAQAGQGVGG
jgi:hypothetical protein